MDGINQGIRHNIILQTMLALITIIYLVSQHHHYCLCYNSQREQLECGGAGVRESKSSKTNNLDGLTIGMGSWDGILRLRREGRGGGDAEVMVQWSNDKEE